MSSPLSDTGCHEIGCVIVDNDVFTLSNKERHDEPLNSARPTDFDSASLAAVGGGYPCHTCVMSVTRSNDHTIYYEVMGNGPRLLFFNGSGATIASTRPLLELFARRFTVAVHDQRGLGESGRPSGPYTMADYARDGLAVVEDLGWTTCRVAGISFGGMVAQEFAVTWPHVVDRLLLLCTSAGGTLGSSFPLHTLADLDAAQRADRMVRLTDTRFTPEWLAEHPEHAALVDDIVKRSSNVKSDDQRRGEVEQLRARAMHDVSDRLHKIVSPTFVASGKYDGIAPPSNGEAIAQAVSGAVFAQYEGGHMFMVQDAAAFPDMFAFLSAETDAA